jgi:UDP-2,3-diacylglucosamine hydrolase
MKLIKNTYFISDVHIGATPKDEEEERLRLFINFLRQIENKASRIFFVGDIFDFWFEYKQTIPKKYFSILHQMARLADKKIEMHYLAGNHDFYLGNFFNKEFGMQTYDNEWTGKINNKNFYIIHGDGIAKKDVGYRILKKIIRNKLNIKLFRLLHPDIGIPFAHFVSGTSRYYTDQIKLFDHTDYIEFAQNRFNEGYDYVVMGHRHNPLLHKENGKEYINLGDWLFSYSYGLFDGRNLLLKNVLED